MKMRLAFTGLLAVILSGCSTPKVIKEPTVLAPLESNYELYKNWQVKTETLANRDSEGLFFSDDVNNLYIANSTGYVVALKKVNTTRWADQVVWQTKFSTPIVSGPAIHGDKLIVGTAKGQLIVLSTTDGGILWQTQLSSEVMSHAIVAEQKIFTRTVDGKLYALDINSGAVVWVAEHQMPNLSLRGSPPVVYNDGSLYVGWESGSIQAFSAKSGGLLWETRVAVPKGRTDLERMVDVQSSLVIKQNRLIAMGFHGKLVSINPDNGDFYFVKEISGFSDMAVNDSSIFVADDSDVIHAFDLLSGAQLWKQEAFKGRLVGDLSLYQDELLVVDGWGYLHWMNTIQGTESSRIKHSNEYGDGNRILRVKVDGTQLTLLDDEGVITHYTVKPSSLTEFKAEHSESTAKTN